MRQMLRLMTKLISFTKRAKIFRYLAEIQLNMSLAKLRIDNKKLRERNDQLLLEKKSSKEKIKTIELLRKMGMSLQYCKSQQEIYEIFYSYIKKIFPHHKTTLWVLSQDKTHLNAAKDGHDALELISTLLSSECILELLNEQAFIHRPSLQLGLQKLEKQYLCIPISAQGKVMGMMSILIEESEISQETQKTALSASADIAQALLNMQLIESLQELSIRDYLTNLYNRRYMEERLSQEIARAKRQSSHIGLMMFDIDYFKKYNDSFGHDTGDAILRKLGKHLQRCFRKSDIVCRFGGEEFLIILPNMDEEAILEKTNYLRDELKKLQININDHIIKNISISVGISSFPKNGKNIKELLDAADAALYQAKKQGRNCVFFAS